MIKYYRLNNNKEVEECDMFQVKEFICSPNKIIKQEEVGQKWVSTVFLSYDHNWGFMKEKRPVLFETMVFSTEALGLEEYCERYCTYQEALDGHSAVVEKLKQGLPLNEHD